MCLPSRIIFQLQLLRIPNHLLDHFPLTKFPSPYSSSAMMNLLALTLIFTSISAASFFSSPPHRDNQVLREGHRLIVVEFERQIPQSSSFASRSGEIADEANEKLLDSASVLPNVGQKAKLSSVLTDTKKATNQLEESAADAVKSVADMVKHMAVRIEESVSDSVKSTAEEAKQKAARIKESAPITLKTDIEKAKQKAAQFHESAGKAATCAAKTAMAASEHVAGNVSASAAKTADMAVAATGEFRRKLTDILHRAWELGRDMAAFVGAWAVEALRSAAAVAHLLGFATAYGTCVWVTFVSNHVLASSMPRQQFGIVQSRIYPIYFRFLALAIGVGLAGHILRGKERVQGYNLIAMLAIVLVNLVWLEPKATKAMFERIKFEKEEGRGRDVADGGTEPAIPSIRKEAAMGRLSELRKKLKSLNNYSSFLNVLTLMGLSWHLVYLA